MSFLARRIVGIIAFLLGSSTIARNYWRGQPNGMFPFMLLFIGIVYLLLTSFGQEENVRNPNDRENKT